MALRHPSHYGIVFYAAPPYTGNRKGASVLEYIANVLVLIVADVAAYCIRKWLEQHRKGQ